MAELRLEDVTPGCKSMLEQVLEAIFGGRGRPNGSEVVLILDFCPEGLMCFCAEQDQV